MWSSGDTAAQVVSKYVALFGLAMFFVVVAGTCADLRIAHRSSVLLDVGGVHAVCVRMPLIGVIAGSDAHWNHRYTAPR
ncbi:hypothetical protein [Nocardia sp. NPDC051832]|uniref:hypothetical protein n=1 Tax=Nocardia sp. NPDC051832 TaxID=3155673 RepID=UPI00341B2C08